MDAKFQGIFLMDGYRVFTGFLSHKLKLFKIYFFGVEGRDAMAFVINRHLNKLVMKMTTYSWLYACVWRQTLHISNLTNYLFVRVIDFISIVCVTLGSALLQRGL